MKFPKLAYQIVKILQQNEELSGFQISQKLEERNHHLVGYGTLYNNLERLEKRGIISGRWIPYTPPDNVEPKELKGLPTPTRRRVYRYGGNKE